MSSDLHILASGECRLATRTQTLSGVRLLGQKFLMELLTERGSMEYLPDRGCHFLSRVRSARNEFDVEVAFVTVKPLLQRLLSGDVSKQTTAHERFADAYLNKIILTGSFLHLEFTVRSVAGSMVRIVTPAIQL